jgi:hypothetical protein
MSPKHLMFNGVPEIKDLEIDLDNVKFERYPYLDSFKWLNLKTKKLYNFIPKDTKDLITISDHMGNFFKADHFGFCDLSNNVYLSHDIDYVDYIDKNVYAGNLCWSKILNRCMLMDHSIEDKEIRDVIFNSDYDHLNDYDKINKKREEIREKKSKGINPWEEEMWWESSPRKRGNYYSTGRVIGRDEEIVLTSQEEHLSNREL